MKITHIISETTTSGSVSTVAAPLFKQRRKGGNLLTGTKTKSLKLVDQVYLPY